MKLLYLLASLTSLSLSASDLSTYQLMLEQDKFRLLQQELGSDAALENKELLVIQLKAMLGLRQSEQAEQLCKKALERYPQDAELLHLAAVNQFNLAQDSSIFSAASYAKAGLALLKQAVAANPQYLDAQQTLIGFYLQAPSIAGGDEEEARRLAKALSDTHQPEGTVVTIEVLIADDKLDDAVRLAEQQLLQHPNHSALLATYAMLLTRKDDVAGAFSQYQKAITASKDLSEQQSYSYQLGRLAATSSADPVLGQQALEGYLNFYQDSDHSKFDWAQLRLAQIYLRQQQNDKAEALLLQLKNKDSDDDKLTAELKKLQKQLKKA